jgi:CubicO group peptidase (beta-lactamase class C family)
MSMAIQRLAVALTLAASVTSVAAVYGQATMVHVDSQVDRIFQRWTTSTPGCAVGAAVDGRPALTKAYGLADLEHDVKNTPETIFEAGSVSKQFTAAAVLLLVREGRLSLDDPARKYLPELRDYGTPLTVRHMLNHTSGLRDWGSVEAIAGWPRTTRVNTHAHVLEILGRQRALNFTPGTRWSYSNSGFNLAAVLVSRVSGMPFAEFSRTRLFEPLGMTHTSWRDDHTRVVKGRAIAYSDESDGFHIDMPFENVHGNGGLLTTVGDLLKWNENFTTPRVGDAAFVKQQQEPGKFNDGRVHDYAFGLMVGLYKGVREVDHSGSTAGYRAHLSRYPDQHLSIAVLCNVTSGAATQYAREVADVYLGDRAKTAKQTASHVLTEAEAARIEGLYRNVARGTTVTLVREQGGMRLERGPALIAMSSSRFAEARGPSSPSTVTSADQTWEFDGRGGARLIDEFGSVDIYERVARATPTNDELKALVGSYVSDEAETTFTAVIDGGSLVLKQRPDRIVKLTPVYADAFTGGPLGMVIFRRDGGGLVTSLSIVQDRVWDLRFVRQPQTTSTR